MYIVNDICAVFKNVYFIIKEKIRFVSCYTDFGVLFFERFRNTISVMFCV